jgi:hypothetical protein
MAESPGPPLQRSTPFSGAAPDYRMKLADLGDRLAAATVNQTPLDRWREPVSACSLCGILRRTNTEIPG